MASVLSDPISRRMGELVTARKVFLQSSDPEPRLHNKRYPWREQAAAQQRWRVQRGRK